MTTTLKLRFDHGLGDCVHIAHLLNVYRRFGFDFDLRVAPNKKWLFETAGFSTSCGGHEGYTELEYGDPALLLDAGLDRYWVSNKSVAASQSPPLPFVATAEDMWSLLTCWPKVDYRSGLRGEKATVCPLLKGLREPVVVVNPKGYTNNARKRLPYDVLLRLCEALVSICGASVAVVGSNAPFSHPQCRSLPEPVFQGNTPNWVALLASCALLVGVDAGPLHLARYTGTKAIGYCPTVFHFPSRFALPDPTHTFVVPARLRSMAEAVKRDYRIAVFDEDPVETIVNQALRVLM